MTNTTAKIRSALVATLVADWRYGRKTNEYGLNWPHDVRSTVERSTDLAYGPLWRFMDK